MFSLLASLIDLLHDYCQRSIHAISLLASLIDLLYDYCQRSIHASISLLLASLIYFMTIARDLYMSSHWLRLIYFMTIARDLYMPFISG